MTGLLTLKDSLINYGGKVISERKRETNKLWHLNHPWYSAYRHAKERCKPKGVYYLRVDFSLSPDDVKYLWFRDQAFNMKCPSIDRINTAGHYILDNCRFIEFEKNNRRKKYGGWLKYGGCTDCGRSDLEHFGKGRCKPCYRRYYYDNNRQKILTKSKEYYVSNNK